MTRVAVIGGSGFKALSQFKSNNQFTNKTEFGDPSSALYEMESDGSSFYFLFRHGNPHRIPPHLVNYRANLSALASRGAEIVIAINSVGAISGSIPVGQLIIPDQLIDYTWGREHTIDIGGDHDLMHVDFTEPFDLAISRDLSNVASKLNLEVLTGSVIGVTQGPRLESAAEIRKLKADGCDLVGMTSMPEAAIARELDLRYASICVVSNPAAGLNESKLSYAEIREVIELQSCSISMLLKEYLKVIDSKM